MRAVNLIPVEDRRSAGAPGRTGGGVYIVLGLLAVVVIAAAAYALTTNQVNQRKADLQKTTLEANAAEAEAAAVKPYADFASLKDQRLQTVQNLAAGRFDWHKVMDEFSRAIPADVRLSSFSGQTSAPDDHGSDHVGPQHRHSGLHREPQGRRAPDDAPAPDRRRQRRAALLVREGRDPRRERGRAPTARARPSR